MIIEIKANNLIVLVKFLLKFQAMLSNYFSTHYLTIRLRARLFYEQIVNEAQPSWLSLVENEGE